MALTHAFSASPPFLSYPDMSSAGCKTSGGNVRPALADALAAGHLSALWRSEGAFRHPPALFVPGGHTGAPFTRRHASCIRAGSAPFPFEPYRASGEQPEKAVRFLVVGASGRRDAEPDVSSSGPAAWQKA